MFAEGVREGLESVGIELDVNAEFFETEGVAVILAAAVGDRELPIFLFALERLEIFFDTLRQLLNCVLWRELDFALL